MFGPDKGPVPGRDRRRFGRRQMACHAYVQVEQQQPVHCIVRNLSDEGALLEFPNKAPDGNDVRLVVDACDIDVMCKVRHRKFNTLGLYFPRPAEAQHVPVEQTGNSVAKEYRDLLAETVA